MKIKKETESLIEHQGKLEKNYSFAYSEEEFKDDIKNHYHGDLGRLFLTPSVGCRTIWQCACGYRSVVNFTLNNFKISDLIEEK